MGIIDWLLLLLLVATLIYGWRKGLIGMLLHLAGVVLVFFLVAHYFPTVRHGLILKLHLGSLLSTILSVILIVAAIALVVQIIRVILEKTLKLMHISFINSALGALLGFLTGLLAIVVLSILIELIPSFRKQLNDPEHHKVYSAVHVVRGELYSAFKIKQKLIAAADSLQVNTPLRKKQK